MKEVETEGVPTCLEGRGKGAFGGVAVAHALPERGRGEKRKREEMVESQTATISSRSALRRELMREEYCLASRT